MQHQWTPEQTIEPPEALRLIQAQFPELKTQKILFLAAGWDNSAFLVDDTFIFRFPRRQIALPLLEAEWCLLPKLHLPQPIPIPKWKGKPSRNYPWPFIGYRMLPGFSACHAKLSEEERVKLASPIAQFLKALHATPKEIISQCPIPGDNLSRVNADLLVPKIENSLAELKLLGLFDQKISLTGTFRKPSASAIVHGDFYVRHLLVNENHQLCGVIDWGDMHLGDPAIDLAIAHSFLPKSAHEAFKKAYGGIDEETWALARIRAIHSACLIALFGHHTKDPYLLYEGLRALKLI